MDVLAILESDIIKDVIEEVLRQEETIDNIKVVNPGDNLLGVDYKSIGMIIIDTRNEYESLICYIENIKMKYKSIKIIIIDVRKRATLFKRLIRKNIEGYIVDILNKDEFAYIINKVIHGKKFYDLDLLQELFKKEDEENKNKLTMRESEILDLVGEGFNNKEISQKLFITENTVKKHVGSIFTKLGFKSRKEVISYVKHKQNSYF